MHCAFFSENTSQPVGPNSQQTQGKQASLAPSVVTQDPHHASSWASSPGPTANAVLGYNPFPMQCTSSSQDKTFPVPDISGRLANETQGDMPAGMPSEAMLQQIADDILDKVVDKQLGEIADRVLAEDVEEENIILPKLASLLTPVRRSKRREATADEDSLERAERLVAIKKSRNPN